MDYKQKYEEALNRAKSLTMPDDLKVAKYIFHELKESDDERIRKKVIEVLKLNIKGAESQMQASRGVDRTFEIYACNKVISWLEKEKTSEEALEYLKENHSVDEVNDFQIAMNIAVAKAFDAGRNSKPFINKEDEEMINLLIAIFEINYPNDVYKANPIGTTNMKGVCSCEIINWLNSLKDRVQPQSTWSEEDEEIANKGVLILKSCAVGFPTDEKFANEFEIWIKSLKNRVQSKQEWSEEDKEMYKKIETAIDSYYAPFSRDAEEMSEWFKNLKYRIQLKQEWSDKDEKIIHYIENAIKYDKSRTYLNSKGIEIIDVCNWLKSIRPQNRWKPSDEQMNTLEYYMHSLICNKHKEILFGLYSDLKKLREE